MADVFELPDLGEGIHEAQIIQMLVNEGDVVEQDQPLMEVETDKAAVEIPSPHSGKINKIHVAAGETVNVGDTLISFGENGAAVVAKPAAKSAPSPKPAAAKAAAPAPSAPALSGRPAKVAASPVVRRLAKERGIDLATITGTGKGGRITREDLESGGSAGTAPRPAARTSPAPAPSTVSMPAGTELPDFTKYGPIRREAIPQIRKTIAHHMVQSEAINVHVTHHDMVDITMLEQLRKDHNGSRAEGDPKLTLLPFVLKAVCAAMRKFPVFNSSFDHVNNEIIYKDFFNFGIAVDTPRGLIVPVVRGVDTKSIRDIATELIGLGGQARDASFGIEDLRGGTFTITNIGSLGGLVSTPIINYPEVAILGLGKADMKPVVRDGAVVARYMLPINMSFDHRVIDGADAARFCSDVMGYLEVPGRLLLEE